MNSKKILFLILLGVVIIPGLSLADSSFAISTMAQAAVKTTFYIADAVVVILWVITGILFLAAQGAPEKLKSAKTALLTAVIGTVVVIVADSAVYLVSNAFNLGL